jgi:hypothetical protein
MRRSMVVLEPSPEIVEEVAAMLKSGRIPALREAGNRVRKTPAPSLKSIDIPAEFQKLLSSYLTTGLVRLSIRKVQASDELQQSLQDSHSAYTILLHRLPVLRLPEYSPHITIALKSGATVIWQADTTFSVTALVTLRNTLVTLREEKLHEFRFGSLNAGMSIYLKRGPIEEALHSFQRDLTIPGMMGGEQ